jgi:hypothetical protein
MSQSPEQRFNGWEEDDFSGWCAEDLIEGVPKEIIDLLAGRAKPTAEDWASPKDDACATPWIEGLPMCGGGRPQLAANGDRSGGVLAGKGS